MQTKNKMWEGVYEKKYDKGVGDKNKKMGEGSAKFSIHPPEDLKWNSFCY